MWSKIKEIIQTIVPILCLVICILLYVSQCSSTGSSVEQLVSLGTAINNLESTIDNIRGGLEQQESLLNELTDNQSRIEQSVADITGVVTESNGYLEQLIGDESNVDGSVGAIRTTVHRLESTISATISAIEQDELE